MKRSGSFFLLVMSVVLVGSWAFSGLGAAEEAEQFTYVGVKTCKMCHNKPATGAQFKIWSEGPHAKAFESLASDAAKATAKEMGLGDPQKEAACLKCHVTAFAVMDDLASSKLTLEEGVSCESCHGAGSGYKSKKVKTAIAAGETEAASVGLIVKPAAELCTTCHQKEGNPNFKEFVYEEMVKKIAHPVPKGE